MAPRKVYTRPAERKPGPKNGLVAMPGNPMRRLKAGKRTPASRSARNTRTFATTTTGSQNASSATSSAPAGPSGSASSAPPASAIGDANGTLGVSTPATNRSAARAPLGAEECPLGVRKPGRRPKQTRQKGTPGTRRSPRNHAGSPPISGAAGASNAGNNAPARNGSTGDAPAIGPNSKSVGTQTSVTPSRVHSGRIIKRFKPALRELYSKGLCNDGRNRCYRNAALQSILHVPAVVHYLKQIHPECDKPVERCIVCALQKLADAYWSYDKELIEGEEQEASLPEWVTDILHDACLVDLPKMDDLAQDFKNEMQADPHQFLQYLITWIKEIDGGVEAPTCSAMFDLMIESTWFCEDCQQNRVETEPQLGCEAKFWEMPTGTTLEQFIRADLTEKHIRRCESDQCEAKYGKNQEPLAERTVTHRWISLPQVFIIRLGRLGWDRERGEPTKDLRHVPYPQRINLRQFLNDGDEEHMYRLDGVIAHNGVTPDVGHYVAAARCPNGIECCVLNDENEVVYSRSFKKMQDPIVSFGAKFQACVLVYSKI